MEKKYIPLAEFFLKCNETSITLTFEELENIMGQELPNAAYLNASWWKKTKPPLTHYLSWTEAEYSVLDVKLGRSITFSKAQQNDDQLSGHLPKHTYIIRQVESDDARNYISLLNAVYAENEFEYYGAAGCDLTVQQVRKSLLEMRKAKNSMYFVCIVNGQFAGYATVNGHHQERTRHIADLRIGVLNSYKRIGIGKALLKYVETWSLENNLKRLQANVLQQNEAAISLMNNAGFNEEGIRLQAFKLDNEYLNEVAYSKIL
ncbi:MAG: GNAT family N-acetyltransferase [Lysinibacillus sp.]